MAYTSTGYAKGDDFGIYVDDTLIAVATENNLNFTRDSIEVSNKDSGADKEYIYGRGDGTVAGSARFKYNAGYGWLDLLTVMEGATVVTVRYSNNVTGDDEHSFSALITSLSRTDPDNDAASISYEFQKTGAVTTAEISA